MWNYLDKIDLNLLYLYAEVLSGRKKQIQNPKSYTEDRTEYEEMRISEENMKRAYYLIWYVYRYILECKTLEEALKYANEETFRKYHLYTYLTNHNVIYIGINKEICFRKNEDIPIILEILYNRYGFFEQMECFIRCTKNVRQTRCKKLLESYRNIYSKIEEKNNENQHN